MAILIVIALFCLFPMLLAGGGSTSNDDDDCIDDLILFDMLDEDEDEDEDW